MAITITLAGTDRTDFCDLRSVYIVDSIQANADTCDLEVAVSTTDSWNPQAGSEIVIASGTSREFAGIVEDVYEELKSPSRLRYQLACRDYTFLFDKFLVVDESTSQQSGDWWVSRIVDTFTTGFSHVNVSTAPNVPARRFDYITPSEAIRSIADELEHIWFIDYNRDVHFVGATAMLAPTTSLNLDTDLTNYGDMHLREAASGLKNRNYMKGYRHKSGAQWNRSFTGDGSTRFFYLGQEPASIDSADMTATLDGTALDLLTDFIDGAPGTSIGSSSQIFVAFDNPGVRFSTGITAPASSQTLSVTFYYMEDAISAVQDTFAQAAIQAREGSSDGVHEYVIDDPNMTAADGSDDLAFHRGTKILSRYANPRLTGSFNSFTQGWQAGQYLTISSTRRMGGFSDTFYVQQVSKRIINHPVGGSPTFHYKVEVADGSVGI